MNPIAQLSKKLQEVCPEVEQRANEPLSQHTSFRIGGPVSLMVLPKTKEQAARVLFASAELGIDPFFLGRGSNLLVADEGIEGVVLKFVSTTESLRMEGDRELVAGAGLSLAQIAVYAMERGLSGLEFAHGIPGSLGGAVFMNAGAYDGEMAQVVTEVCCLNKKGEEKVFSAEQLDFSYRHSIFSDESHLIVSVRLKLREGRKELIQAKMAELMERRRSKQPLEFPSAGSTFKRPVGYFAGTLIEQAGLKGASVGGAQVSKKHAGFIINTGNATCEDVLQLMRSVRRIVQRDTGVLLEPEVRLIGCSL